MSYRQQKDTMTDREGLKSTISSGHGQSKGTCRSLILDEYSRVHRQMLSWPRRGWISELKMVGKDKAGGGSFNLGHRRKP